jgi:hypothetical protein
MRRVLCALALAFAFIPIAVRAEGSCREGLEATTKAIPTLEAQAFDAAWRALSKRECYRESAQALAAYIETHGHVYHLGFHQGQMLLFAGESKKARPLLLSALRPELPEDAPFKWNAYVLATVAYIDGDRERFLRERARIEAARDYAPNAMNLKVLDALLKDFDGNYLRAMNAMQAAAAH